MLPMCESGSLSACAIIAGNGAPNYVDVTTSRRALVVACGRDVAYCAPLGMFAKQYAGDAEGAAMLAPAMKHACDAFRYADGCTFEGQAAEKDNRIADAASAYLRGCGYSVDILQYTVPAIGADSIDYVVRNSSNPSAACDHLADLLHAHSEVPSTPEQIETLSNRSDMLHEEHEQADKAIEQANHNDAMAALDKFQRELDQMGAQSQAANQFVQSQLAISQSLQAMRQNVASTVQSFNQSRAGSTSAGASHAAAGPVPGVPGSIGSGSSAGPDSTAATPPTGGSATSGVGAGTRAGADQQEVAMKAANLKKCLDEDQNCTYGSSSRCSPATAYGDHWVERRQYEIAQTTLKLCGSDQNFPRDCGQKVMQATPTREQQQAIVDRIRELDRRASALPASYNCPLEPSIDTYNGSSVDDYCNYARSFGTCMGLLVSDAAALESARKLDECVYYGTFQYTRDQLRAQHDADCHKQWDAPTAGQ